MYVNIYGYLGNAETVYVPERIEGMPVSELANRAFQQTDSKAVIIPNKVKKMGIACFEDCKNLEYVKLSYQIKEIPEYSFHLCESMSYFAIPDTVQSIGHRAFDGTGMFFIYVPASVERIASSAFSDMCVYVEHTVRPEGYQEGFLQGTVLYGVDGYGVTQEGLYYAFVNGQAHITAFEGFTEKLTIPESIEGCPVTEIAGRAFYASGLKLGEGGEPIALYAVKEIIIPKTVRTISEDSFFSMENGVESITVDANNPYFESYEGALYTEGYKKLIAVPSIEMQTFAVREETSVIGSYAFFNAVIGRVKIPVSVVKFEEYAFYSAGMHGQIGILEYAGTQVSFSQIEKGEDYFENSQIEEIKYLGV